MVNKISLLFLTLCLSQISYAAVIATVDRSEIAINESFTLRYESSEDENRTPDFSPISKDFDIVGQNRESDFRIINGKISQKTIFNLNLIAKRAGTLTIPEITFAGGVSASIIINVKQQVDRSNDKDISFTVSADKQQSYIQEQIILTVKLARAIHAQQESISDLKFNHEDIIIEPLSDEYKQYEAMLNGRRHIVYERQYAIFPQKAGPLELAPLSYGAVIPKQQRRRGNFFDDPFFNRSTGKRIREQSKKIVFNIKAKPDAFIGKHWLPANNIDVTASLSNNANNAKVGDSITRTIIIKADQQLASTLPQVITDDITDAKTYPDQADTTQQKAKYGIYSQRVERTAIVPTAAGEIVFPASNIEWWNTRTKQKEVASIPAQTIYINAAADTDLVPHSNSRANISNSTSAQTSGKWFYIALLTFAGWLLTTLAWLYFAVLKPRLPGKQTITSKEDIIKACKNHNAAAAKDALLAWAKQQWPEKNISNLGTLSNIANNDALAHALNDLQNNLYGQSATKWNSNLLIKCIKNFSVKKAAPRKAKHLLFNIQ